MKLMMSRSQRQSRVAFAQFSNIILGTNHSGALKGWNSRLCVVVQNNQILKRNFSLIAGEFFILE